MASNIETEEHMFQFNRQKNQHDINENDDRQSMAEEISRIEKKKIATSSEKNLQLISTIIYTLHSEADDF